MKYFVRRVTSPKRKIGLSTKFAISGIFPFVEIFPIYMYTESPNLFFFILGAEYFRKEKEKKSIGCTITPTGSILNRCVEGYYRAPISSIFSLKYVFRSLIYLQKRNSMKKVLK